MRRLTSLITILAALCLTEVALTTRIVTTGEGDDAHPVQASSRTFKLRHMYHYGRVGTLPTVELQHFDEHRTIQESLPPLTKFEVQIRGRDEYVEGSTRIEDSHQHQLQLESSRATPNISDKQTVVNLAKMTSDAYLFDPREPDWLNTSLGFNFTERFGWDEDGLRGHVFSTEDYSTIVVSFKGTTINPRDKLSGRDRVNDNRLFSCCCAAQNPYRLYGPVCNCPTGYYECDSGCLTSSLLRNDSYYDAALFVTKQVQRMYPAATFWVVGHSLGGSLASLVGLTLDIPSITFEAPPERLPARRIGLLSENSTAPANRATSYHFGNSADPVYLQRVPLDL